MSDFEKEFRQAIQETGHHARAKKGILGRFFGVDL